MACFTRPELKVERVSYDVITPSAARAIFEAIFWKPAIHWQITKIEVLNPIKWTSVRRNEVGAVASKSVIYIEDKRQQKNSLLLKDVRYRIWAKMEYRPVAKRKAEGNLFAHEPGKDENPMKYYQMFEQGPVFQPTLSWHARVLCVVPMGGCRNGTAPTCHFGRAGGHKRLGDHALRHGLYRHEKPTTDVLPPTNERGRYHCSTH